MTDDSNGESTFEFVEKRIDDVSISGEPGKAGQKNKMFIFSLHPNSTNFAQLAIFLQISPK